MATTHDTLWPRASSLLTSAPAPKTAVMVGVSTYQTSLSPRSSSSTPSAIRAALNYYSTWSFHDGADLAGSINLRDLGDLERPDDDGARERLRTMLTGESDDLVIVLGGDNAATWLGAGAFFDGALANAGLITLDAHLDLRDGRSNGSPVRQLLDEGLAPEAVVQVGLAEFANSPAYARRARDRGLSSISRRAFDEETPEALAQRALAIAGADNRSIYVDLDFDVVDRSAVPGCPAAAPGGISPHELRRFARAVARDARVAAVDLTEIDVERDVNEATVRLAALVVLELLAGVCERGQ